MQLVPSRLECEYLFVQLDPSLDLLPIFVACGSVALNANLRQVFLCQAVSEGREPERLALLDCPRYALDRLFVVERVAWKSDWELEKLRSRIDQHIEFVEEGLERGALRGERRMAAFFPQLEGPALARVSEFVGNGNHLFDEREQSARDLNGFRRIALERRELAATHLFFNRSSLYERIVQLADRGN